MKLGPGQNQVGTKGTGEGFLNKQACTNPYGAVPFIQERSEHVPRAPPTFWSITPTLFARSTDVHFFMLRTYAITAESFS